MRKQHARLDAIMRMINSCDRRLIYMQKHQHYNDLIARTSRIRNRLYLAYTNQLTKMFQDVLWTRPRQAND
ncbi:hypothetical protein UFOVP25_15 [uncultured Caudovirales phage]|uniref:Uncharacterized protein n=1 Tax=uncultured Caudovirales phage TaxID=2100421 RepID=A0A6J5KI30_9CAUD|nr:hypothetical protein UFOVP25_15 [uncultured Caudovirales phage]